MKVTRLKNVSLFEMQLKEHLAQHKIELYDIKYPSASSISFRARRTYNKPYVGGGVKYGEPIARNGLGMLLYPSILEPKFRQSKVLHWEEWALINNTINDLCDKENQGGSLKSWFDGGLRWIRQNGVVMWYADL